MNKKELSEQDICTKFITPSLVNSGWDIFTQVSEQKTFTSGKIILDDEENVYREELKKYDYLLSYKQGVPLAIIEAKDNKHSVGEGMQQGLEYAEILDVPFVYSSNGDAFIEHDRLVENSIIEREIKLKNFPSPEELWERYKKEKNITEEESKVILQPYYISEDGRNPRYYQRIAINRVIEGASKGRDRMLLVMATGSGKTYVAFQIIWRLWTAKKKKRILFLADRNILIDQTMTNDFKYFKDKMTKIDGRKIDKSYEIYLALYQGIAGNDDFKNVYKEFSNDFFDLIIVDECHRGSIDENSNWHEILKYFSSATQIGLTATPKDEENASNFEYFGEPIYTYSLKQGIEDGFLAPYKVVNINIDIDSGFKVEDTMIEDKENILIGKNISQENIDENVIIDNRTKVVAKRISEFLKETDRYSKTIVFCSDVPHAERMRSALINENSDLYSKNSKYIMRITGDDNRGKLELDNFIDPKETFPVIVTTSKLLSTGVDAQTCKLIVLDKNIKSLTEFKQIVGRGTRISEKNNKFFFTILDFRNATKMFNDPNFDGEPMDRKELNANDTIDKNNVKTKSKFNNKNKGEVRLIKKSNIKSDKIKIENINVNIASEEIKYYDESGNIIDIKSFEETVKTIINDKYGDLSKFKEVWANESKKISLITEIQRNISVTKISKEYENIYDLFDIICNLAYNSNLITKEERINRVKKSNFYNTIEEEKKEITNYLIDKYKETDITQIENINILKVHPFNKLGSLFEIINIFGGVDKYKKFIDLLVGEIYSELLKED
ncbi:EcoAI/FtnUII family type I restriction enzme subunit R [Clostridium perfringens]|uniref:EcoAI/FtnUII family type I restriction enzme subunit R n=1 Tax=Clostridium perfringens TaxID=1502 RepID=UPI003D2F7060